MNYVLDKKLPYDNFLGRSLIRPMMCVTSTLHRLIKFNHDGKEYVMDKNPNIIIQVWNTIIPYQNIKIHEDNDENNDEDEEDNDTM